LITQLGNDLNEGGPKAVRAVQEIVRATPLDPAIQANFDMIGAWCGINSDDIMQIGSASTGNSFSGFLDNIDPVDILVGADVPVPVAIIGSTPSTAYHFSDAKHLFSHYVYTSGKPFSSIVKGEYGLYLTGSVRGLTDIEFAGGSSKKDLMYVDAHGFMRIETDVDISVHDHWTAILEHTGNSSWQVRVPYGSTSATSSLPFQNWDSGNQVMHVKSHVQRSAIVLEFKMLSVYRRRAQALVTTEEAKRVIAETARLWITSSNFGTLTSVRYIDKVAVKAKNGGSFWDRPGWSAAMKAAEIVGKIAGWGSGYVEEISPIGGKVLKAISKVGDRQYFEHLQQCATQGIEGIGNGWNSASFYGGKAGMATFGLAKGIGVLRQLGEEARFIFNDDTELADVDCVL
jgi:hypothetical protein